MNLITEPYLAQQARWPRSGRHILAQFDADSVVVYQAYNPAIGHFAARHGYFGGGFRHGPDELDQAELPLDDVPLGLGHQGGPGGDAGDPTQEGRLRRDPPAGGPLVLRPGRLQDPRGMAAGRRRVRRPAAMGPRPRAVRATPSSGGRSNSACVATCSSDTPRSGRSTSRTSPPS